MSPRAMDGRAARCQVALFSSHLIHGKSFHRRPHRPSTRQSKGANKSHLQNYARVKISFFVVREIIAQERHPNDHNKGYRRSRGRCRQRRGGDWRRGPLQGLTLTSGSSNATGADSQDVTNFSKNLSSSLFERFLESSSRRQRRPEHARSAGWLLNRQT